MCKHTRAGVCKTLEGKQCLFAKAAIHILDYTVQIGAGLGVICYIDRDKVKLRKWKISWSFLSVITEKQHWYIELGWYAGDLGPTPAFTTEWLREHD